MVPRVDLQLNGDQMGAGGMVRMARAAEDAGLAGVWTGEAFHDALVTAGAIATATSRVALGTNLAQWTRTPATCERAAADVDALAGGRFTLGLGPMPQAWNEDWHGIPFARPVERMREYVACVRTLWQAGPQAPRSFAGQHFRVEDYVRLTGPLERPVPIHLGATGPRMAALAGEIADGVHFNALLSPAYVRERLLPRVAEGAQRAGRALGDVRRGGLVIAAVDDRPAEAARRVRHQLAFYLGLTDYFAPLLAFHGLEQAGAEIKTRFASGDVAGAITAVPDAMVSAFAIAGRPDDVRVQLTGYADVLDHAILYAPSFLLAPEEVTEAHERLITTFAP